MARAALLALTWAAAAAAAAASAARYMDYSGVKMPQYGPGDYDSARETAKLGSGAEDYHGHSVDASAALDYKFEEDSHGQSDQPLKETHDRQSWSKFSRRQRELDRLHDDETLDTLDKYDPELEEFPKDKFNRRSSMHRPRIKNRKSRKNYSTYKRLDKYSRGRSERIDSDKEYFQINGDDVSRDNEKETEEAVDLYGHTQVTQRIIRRKPRDRVMRGRMRDEGDMGDEDLEPNRRMKPERRTEPDYVFHDEDRQRPTELEQKQEPYRPVMEQIDDANIQKKQKSRTYSNYGDYYDMKRVHNIKNKLPMLLKRTTARVTPPTVSGISTHVLDVLWTRRSNVPAAPVPGLALSVVPLPSPSVAADASSSKVTSTQMAASNVSEISLAEKSRLSILKKAQRKESLRSNTSTLKPPVLLQVTDKRLTVVIVEPPSSEGPWMRAREVTNDSPERVERAKRLMRSKLVARARNIQELTDNWDEMICDYIDVSLLDHAQRPFALSALTPAALALLLFAL